MPDTSNALYPSRLRETRPRQVFQPFSSFSLGVSDAGWMAVHPDSTVQLMGRRILWTLRNCRWPAYRESRIRAYLREAEDVLSGTSRTTETST